MWTNCSVKVFSANVNQVDKCANFQISKVAHFSTFHPKKCRRNRNTFKIFCDTVLDIKETPIHQFFVTQCRTSKKLRFISNPL